jgi:hypothetical protein
MAPKTVIEPVEPVARCPFCGELEAMACEFHSMAGGAAVRPRVVYAVVCHECGARGPEADAFEAATTEWCSRADDDLPPHDVVYSGGWLLLGVACGQLLNEGIETEQIIRAIKGLPVE